MPGAPREDVFDPEVVGIYHCYNRCSQRAFLCGFDPVTQQDFSHRKQWVQDRLKLLARSMAVEILDYAVLDNHLHCVLRNRPDLVGTWPDEEVVRRWWLLCPDRRDERGEPAEISNIELQARLADHEQVAEYRKRLSCISWFMRLLCQPIARRANHESDVTGRFFAHRFGCERILDMAGLLACSMYVDLNLVRAGVAKTPEESVYTSAYDRIRGHMFRQAQSLDQDATEILVSEGPDDWLAPLFLDQRTDAYLDAAASGSGQADLADDTGVTNESPEETQVEPSAAASRRLASRRLAMARPLGSARASDKGFLPMTLKEYLTLLDWTGRELRADKRGGDPCRLTSYPGATWHPARLLAGHGGRLRQQVPHGNRSHGIFAT